MKHSYPRDEIRKRILPEKTLPVVRYRTDQPESIKHYKRFGELDPWGHPAGAPAFSMREKLKRTKVSPSHPEYDPDWPDQIHELPFYSYVFVHKGKEYTAADVVWDYHFPRSLEVYGGHARTINGCMLDLRRHNLFCTGIENIQTALANYKPWNGLSFREKKRMRQENILMTRSFIRKRVQQFHVDERAKAEEQGLPYHVIDLGTRAPKWYKPEYDPYAHASQLAPNRSVSELHYPRVQKNEVVSLVHMDSAESGAFTRNTLPGIRGTSSRS